jgi:hypothetical protein
MTSTLPGAGYIISMFVFEFATWTGVLARHDPEPPPAHQSRQTLLAIREGHGAEVFTVELEEIEGIQRGLPDGAAALPRLEVFGVAPPKTR